MYHIIVNPIAGRGRAIKWKDAVENELNARGADFKTLLTESKGDAARLAQIAKDEGSDGVALISGDGTNHELLFVLRNTGIKVCFMPAGSGNDLAKLLKIPFKPEKAVELLLNGPQADIDVGRVNDGCFINIAGMGLDVDINNEVEKLKDKLKGMPAYLVALIRVLKNFKYKNVSVEIDGGKRDLEAVLIAVANGSSFGGGMKVAPLADPSDGLFDVCCASKMTIPRLCALLPRFIFGKHLGAKEVYYTKAKEVVIRGEGMLDYEIDGEVMSSPEIRLSLEGKLRVCTYRNV